MQATNDAVVALTDAFCRDHLNDEYRDLARVMAAALCRKRPSPLASGQPRAWACGIIHVLGRLNFLSDKASQPYMTMAEVSAAFGVGESTASAKARAISEALRTDRMDPAWMLKTIVDRNPIVWMAEVDGLLVDLRDMPREVQASAYELGMIPYPADRGSLSGAGQAPHASEGALTPAAAADRHGRDRDAGLEPPPPNRARLTPVRSRPPKEP